MRTFPAFPKDAGLSIVEVVLGISMLTIGAAAFNTFFADYQASVRGLRAVKDANSYSEDFGRRIAVQVAEHIKSGCNPGKKPINELRLGSASRAVFTNSIVLDSNAPVSFQDAKARCAAYATEFDKSHTGVHGRCFQVSGIIHAEALLSSQSFVKSNAPFFEVLARLSRWEDGSHWNQDCGGVNYNQSNRPQYVEVLVRRFWTPKASTKQQASPVDTYYTFPLERNQNAW
jgi:hypothetical protein